MIFFYFNVSAASYTETRNSMALLIESGLLKCLRCCHLCRKGGWCGDESRMRLRERNQRVRKIAEVSESHIDFH